KKRATTSSKSGSEASPVTWNEVTGAYERVLDYACLYEKEERAISNGEKQTIRLSFRKPLDVRLEWLNEQGKIDQTAVYRQGFNDGKVLARQSRLLGALAGKLRLDPNEALALSDSRHPITEVGLGNIIASSLLHRERIAGTPSVQTGKHQSETQRQDFYVIACSQISRMRRE